MDISKQHIPEHDSPKYSAYVRLTACVYVAADLLTE